MLDPNAALVLFSGGQDSATCLAWALERFSRVETVGFDYGQRHAVELDARRRFRAAVTKGFPDWAGKLRDDHLVDLTGFGAIGGTAMTSEVEIAIDESGLPTTFVPARNLMFLAAAAAVAYRRDLGVLVGGMCQTDYSGYPDCRDDAVQAMARALALGLGQDIAVETPLMHLTKAQSWELADALGGPALIDLIVEDTHTCYRGERGERHAWGYGCGDCPACDLRAKGWAAFMQERCEAP